MIHRFVASWLLRGGAIAGVLLCSSPAAAFCRTTTCATRSADPTCVRDPNGCWVAGAPLYWESSCTSYSVQQDGSPNLGIDYDTAVTLAVGAFAHWPAAMCGEQFPSISVEDFGPASCNRPEYNPTGPNANVIMFRDQSWTHASTALALTTVTFNTTNGKILGADMEINSTGAFPLDANNLRYVLTHESGHFFGLDHSQDSSAIMYFQYTLPGSNAPDPVLTPDDVAAICATYPPDRVATECRFEPALGFAPNCGGDVTGGCSVGQVTRANGSPVGPGEAALLLGTLLALARKRRRGARTRPTRG